MTATPLPDSRRRPLPIASPAQGPPPQQRGMDPRADAHETPTRHRPDGMVSGCAPEPGLAQGPDGRTVRDLDPWFWESVFGRMSCRERMAAERVCRRWYELLRSARLWTRLVLREDAVIKDKLNKGYLDWLVKHSMGPRVFRPAGSLWPMPSALREVDLGGCSFRGVSPLKLLDLLTTCPMLEVLKISGLRSSLTGSLLFFHCKDFPHMEQVVQQFGRNLKTLEVDLRVQSIWSYESQNPYMDPRWWGQLLVWLKDEKSRVKVKVLDIHQLPCVEWAMGATEGSMRQPTIQLKLMTCAISANTTVLDLTFGPECGLGDLGAVSFLQGIKGNKTLVHLGMSGNKITSKGASAMAQILRDGSDGFSISVLDLTDDDVDKDACSDLLTALATINSDGRFAVLRTRVNAAPDSSHDQVA